MAELGSVARKQTHLPINYLGALMGDSPSATVGPAALKLLAAAKRGALVVAEKPPELNTFVAREDLLDYLAEHCHPTDYQKTAAFQWAAQGLPNCAVTSAS